MATRIGPADQPDSVPQRFGDEADQETVLQDIGSTQHPSVEDLPDRRSPSADGVTAEHNPGAAGDGSLWEDSTVKPVGAPGAGSRPVRFGDYELLFEIARGGMGVVFKARQIKANRAVALKMILSGDLASPADIQRFQVEAKAAANLEHPNIVPVFDVGECDGQHYFSMGFVEGQSLAARVQDGPLDPREAVRLMDAVADGIDYAHQRGTVHRDLKPSNVLLDPSGQPRITDFGLAKDRRDESGLTMTGQILGTPSFMPPEQARGEDVGPLADVYSLGATLYHLLTGRPPFSSARVVDTLQQVMHDQPVPPRQINPAIDRDLETICLCCLQKEPAKRYGSAAAFQTDLRRWLNHEPILARPVSLTERTIRWCRRRPGIAGLLALVAIVTITGFTAVTIQWRETERQRIQVVANLNESIRQRERRDANFETALKAVDQLLTHVGEESLANVPRMQRVRRQMLEDAASFYEQFAQEKVDDPDLAAEVARAQIRIGEIRTLLAENNEADAAFQRAVSRLERIVADYPEQPTYRRDLVRALSSSAKFLYSEERVDEAVANTRQAISIQESLLSEGADEPSRMALAELHGDLGSYLRATARVEECEAELRQGLSMADSIESRTAEVEQLRAALRFVLADVLFEQLSRFEDAETVLHEAIGLLQQLLEEDPDSRDRRILLTGCRHMLAVLVTGQGRLDDAEHNFRESADSWRRLADDYPYIPSYRDEYAAAVMDCAIIYSRMGNLEKSAELFAESIEISERLVADTPLPDYRRSLATKYNNLGALLQNTGQAVQAEAVQRKSVLVREQLVAEFPDNPLYQHQLNISLTNLANAILVADETSLETVSEARRQEADGYLIRAIELGEALLNQPNTSPIHRHKQVITWRVRGQLWKSADPVLAESAFNNSLALIRALIKEMPDDPKTQRQLAYSLHQLADVLLEQDKHEQAEQAAREAFDTHSRLAETTGLFVFRLDQAISARNLGDLLQLIGRTQQSIAAYEDAVRIGLQLVDENPDHRQAADQVAESRDSLALLLATCRDPQFRDVQRALDLARQVVASRGDERTFLNTLAIVHCCAEQWEQALDTFATALELEGEPDPAGELYFVMALVHSDRSTEALQVFQTIADSWPPDATDELLRLRDQVDRLLQSSDKS